MPFIQRIGSASARGFGFGKSGNIYEKTVNEEATASDAISYKNFIPQDVLEGATAAEQLLTILSAQELITEGSTAADSVASIATQNQTISESARAVDEPSVIGSSNIQLNESAQIVDSAIVIGSVNAERSEGASITDSASGVKVIQEDIDEAVLIIDDATLSKQTQGQIFEEALGEDEVSRLYLVNTSISETSRGVDAASGSLTIDSLRTEIATIVDSASGVLNYWIASLSEASNNTMSVYASTIDTSGNIYVTGLADTSSIANGVLVAKYNNQGVIQWLKILETVSITEYGTAIALDSTRNIYIAALINSGSTTSTRYNAVIKYDNDGNLLYQNHFNAPSGYVPMTPKDITIYDTDLYIYVCGQYGNTTSSDIYMAEVYTDCTVAYIKGVSQGYDYGNAILIDNYGNLLIAGSVGVVNTSAEEIAGYVRIDQSGNFVNSYSFTNVTATLDSRFYGAVMSPNWNYYFCGVADYNTVGYHYAIVCKVDDNNNLLWTRGVYYPNGGSSDQFRKIALDADENVYVLGFRSGGITYDRVTIFKYDTNGNLLWQRYIALTSSSVDLVPGDISIDSTSMYITCYTSTVSFTLKLPIDGTLTGTYTVGSRTIVYGVETLTDVTLIYSWTSRTPTTTTKNINQLAGGATSFSPTVTEAITYI